MATTRNELRPVSWKDLLSAISPPKATPEELYELALDEITAAWQEGHLTDAEADGLIKELPSARMHYEIRGMIDDAFSPDIGRRIGNTPRRCFSLL